MNRGSRFGYKWFDAQKKQALFAFGFGLSYRTCRYTGLKVDATHKTASFTIEDSGSREGTEIAQVCVQLTAASGENFRWLAGWQRVHLKERDGWM